MSGAAAGGWRLHGQLASLEEFVRFLWDQSDFQTIVLSKNSGEPLGLLQAYGTELAPGHTKISALFAEQVAGSGLPAEAFARFADHLFALWPLKKIYVEAPSDVASLYGSLLRPPFTQEAHYRDYLSRGDELLDLQVFSATRAAWFETAAPLRPHNTTRSRSTAHTAEAGVAPALISVGSFGVELAKHLGHPELQAVDLDEEMGLDSVDVLRAILWIEDLAGVEGDESFPTMHTKRDAWSYYSSIIAVG